MVTLLTTILFGKKEYSFHETASTITNVFRNILEEKEKVFSDSIAAIGNVLI